MTLSGKADTAGLRAKSYAQTLRRGSGDSMYTRKAKTKSGRRDLSLPDIVVETLREHRKDALEMHVALGLGRLEPDALVFTVALDNEVPISPHAFSGEWRDVANAIGLAGVPLHALRHTHVSQLITPASTW
jgi:integrase